MQAKRQKDPTIAKAEREMKGPTIANEETERSHNEG
jgi:hypothetical protein